MLLIANETALRLSLEFHAKSCRSASELPSPVVKIDDVIADAMKILQFIDDAEHQKSEDA